MYWIVIVFIVLVLAAWWFYPLPQVIPGFPLYDKGRALADPNEINDIPFDVDQLRSDQIWHQLVPETMQRPLPRPWFNDNPVV